MKGTTRSRDKFSWPLYENEAATVLTLIYLGPKKIETNSSKSLMLSDYVIGLYWAVNLIGL